MEKRITEIKVNTENFYYVCFKQGIDFFGALIALVILLPVFIIISSFYFFGDNKGPIIFKQMRIGKYGNKFYIYKFRSMIVDAEKRLKDDNKLYEKYQKNNYKLEPHEDPRITNFGRFIRKTSLDELPQFFNVIKGEMSLVGPRPIVEEELAEYKNKQEMFLSIKPGITGYWQVYGRSEISYPERCELELEYLNKRSTVMDMKILLLTIINVIRKKGAY